MPRAIQLVDPPELETQRVLDPFAEELKTTTQSFLGNGTLSPEQRFLSELAENRPYRDARNRKDRRPPQDSAQGGGKCRIWNRRWRRRVHNTAE